MRRHLRHLLTAALIAAAAVLPTSAPAAATEPPPAPVYPQWWADSHAKQLDVLDYWTGDNLARWNFTHTDYPDGPLYTDNDRGRKWSATDPARTAAVTRTVGRLFSRQTATWQKVSRPSVAGDVVGKVYETHAYRAWDDTNKVLIPADPTKPEERHFVETQEIIDVSNGQTTEYRHLSWPSTCSANAVDGDNGRTVVTAGHCVLVPIPMIAQAVWLGSNWAKDAIDITNDKQVFVPGYLGDAPDFASQAPYGVWVVDKIYTTGQWSEFSRVGGAGVNMFNFQYDVAMLTVLDPLRPGVRLTDVTGSQHIAFTSGVDKLTYAFGYPAAPSFGSAPLARYDGRNLVYAKNPARRDLLMSLNYTVSANLSGGASGGPMLQDFDPVTGIGTQVSVNSFNYSQWMPFGNAENMVGPSFTETTRILYNLVRLA
ncbi:trypsin-like serine peptidase [Yinghuangia seranimata]|uniref:trypsin-like serine peptidase n=1 Tax=Yinghuangia seranimata TaxID=408067 RepID=UPI00248D3113|nr:hypothetical protein [Yinghuangia seranimata]MDI2130666.1 hypothetical protein [Yinghuangia seranimata]